MRRTRHAILTLLLLSSLLRSGDTFAQSDLQPGAAAQDTLARYPTGTGTPLGARIDALLRAPDVAGAHWGIAITTMDGTPVYGLDEAKLFRPASTAKLFTTAAAMEMLGPNATVTTRVTGELDPATGVVRGDLNLIGAGDPSFATHDLPYRVNPASTPAANDLVAIADQLVAKGLRQVTGRIIGDDALFGHEPPPEGWMAEDAVWGYGALPSALSVDDNELRLTITPGDLGSATTSGSEVGASVTVDQLTPYLTVGGAVRTVAAGTQPQSSFSVVANPDRPESLEVYGTIAAGAAPISGHVAIPEPAHYAAESMKQLLLARGVAVDGSAVAFHAVTDQTEPYLTSWRKPDRWDERPSGEGLRGYGFSCGAAAFSQHVLAEKISAPLHEEITFTLKTSANLHAEMLLRQLGLQNACPGSSAVNGARLIRSYLVHAGLVPGDFVFYDGSGLSTKDLVTPRAEARLLAYAAKQPWFAQWKAALPVGGVDGTLASRFTSAPLKGHVFAKTGTLGESRTLAGYVQCASGREVIFSILVDNHQPGSSADRSVMDKLVEAIAASN